MARREVYSTDLTDKQWHKLQAVWPKAKNGRSGRPRKHPLREVVNTVFYQLRTGCAWRLWPHDLVPWPVAWEHFCRWRHNGTLQVIHDALYQQAREKAGRDSAPSAGAIDSQAVRTTEKGGQKATSAVRR